MPSLQSERRAIYAPDPMHLAGLGLKDAEGALKAGADRTEAQLRKVGEGGGVGLKPSTRAAVEGAGCGCS